MDYQKFDGRVPLTKEAMNRIASDSRRNVRLESGSGVEKVDIGSLTFASAQGRSVHGIWARITHVRKTNGLYLYSWEECVPQRLRVSTDYGFRSHQTPLSGTADRSPAIEKQNRPAPIGSIHFLRMGPVELKQGLGQMWVFDTHFQGLWATTVPLHGVYGANGRYAWMESESFAQILALTSGFRFKMNGLAGSPTLNPLLEKNGIPGLIGTFWATPGDIDPSSGSQSWVFDSRARQSWLWRIAQVPIFLNLFDGSFGRLTGFGYPDPTSFAAGNPHCALLSNGIRLNTGPYKSFVARHVRFGAWLGGRPWGTGTFTTTYKYVLTGMTLSSSVTDSVNVNNGSMPGIRKSSIDGNHDAWQGNLSNESINLSMGMSGSTGVSEQDIPDTGGDVDFTWAATVRQVPFNVVAGDIAQIDAPGGLAGLFWLAYEYLSNPYQFLPPNL